MRPLGTGLHSPTNLTLEEGAGASILTGAARFLAKDLASRVVWGSNHRSRGIIAGDSDDREGNLGLLRSSVRRTSADLEVRWGK